MKYAHIIDTKIQGWYDDSIHSKIPTPNIEVTDKVWQEAININANYYENGKFIVKDFRTADELETQAIAEYKASRQEAVNNIKVTTEAGNTFDGDETSQTRMVRAASLMDDEEVTTWVLADNTVIEVTKAELMEASKLAGQEQTKLWIKE